MGATHYANRSPSSAHEAALIFCADFALECKRRGDMSNFYRWRMVLKEHRPPPLLGRTVAEKQQMDQLSLM